MPFFSQPATPDEVSPKACGLTSCISAIQLPYVVNKDYSHTQKKQIQVHFIMWQPSVSGLEAPNGEKAYWRQR